MKKLLLVVLLGTFMFNLYGQELLELKNNQFEGYIIMKNGDKKEGIIEVENINQPWSFQSNIKFFDAKLLEKKKIKSKDKKTLKPGKVIEYGFGEKVFKYIEYRTKSVDNSNSLSSGLSMLKNLAVTKYFAEVYYDGAISLYRFYNSPPDFSITTGDSQAKSVEEYIEECKTYYEILIEKKSKKKRRKKNKAKNFKDFKVKKFFKDCKFVVKKYKKKKYTKKPIRGLKSLFKHALLSGEALAEAAMEMINDYEKECAK